MGPDRSSTNKYLSINAKITKIGPVDPEIIGLRAIIKKRKKIKKLTQAKYIGAGQVCRAGYKHLLEISQWTCNKKWVLNPLNLANGTWWRLWWLPSRSVTGDTTCGLFAQSVIRYDVIMVAVWRHWHVTSCLRQIVSAAAAGPLVTFTTARW